MEVQHLSMPYQGLMICPDGITSHSESQDTLTICSSCLNFLRRGRIPCLALANDTYIGDIPSELQNLSFVEELMIGLCCAKCSIFQLCESRHERVTPVSQTAFRGHIIVYPQDPSSILSLLPPQIEEITSLICILFIGSTKPSLKWLYEKAKPLAVRANKVRNALLWLKRNNRLYEDVILDESVLHSLPDDGILPFHIEHISTSYHQDSLTSTYDNTRNVNNQQNSSATTNGEISFEKIVIADVDGHTTSNDLRVAALNHVQKKGGECLIIPHGRDPLCEFNNPSLFPKMFPTLFPYGVGGFEDDIRKYKIPFKRHIKHFLSLNDKRFREHHSFGFIAFNMIQRRTVLLHTHLQMKRVGFPAAAQNYDTISSEIIARVTERMSNEQFTTNFSYNEDERHVQQLMQDLRLINSHVPGSSSA
jgi:uncharacterized protein DUF6570/helitron helicase-like protein